MEKEIISASIASLPKSELGAIQSDREIWEGTDGGAHFKVTRHILPGTQANEVIALSISGTPDERRRVIKDFKQVFGVPVGGDVSLKDPTHVDILEWLT